MRGNALVSVVREDLRRSKTVSAVIASFVAAAALLSSTAAGLAVSLAGSVDDLMTRARTPHFMQMHTGPLDGARLAAFAASAPGAEAYRAAEFLNLDGELMAFDGRSLGDSLQDNGLCEQGVDFDLLLDLDGNPIVPADGEIYAPVCYLRDGTIAAGARATVAGRPFRVAGFLRDSMMNSPLASSKRFLVSPRDFAALRPFGRIEYLIEFRLSDPEKLASFEAAYAAAALEANGPTLSHSLFRAMNALSDGVLIALLLLMGALVSAIAFLCVRFTLLAKIEEDAREIGVMKAIGLRTADISRMYRAKYAVLALAGSLAGWVLSIPLSSRLSESARVTMGVGAGASWAAAAGALGSLAAFLSVVAYVSFALRRFRSISAAAAIRFGSARGDPERSRLVRLGRGAFRDANVFLGVADVLSRKRIYATMLVVLALAVFVALVPNNLRTTLSSPGFCRYLGVGDCDIRMDVQQTDGVAVKASSLAAALAGDPEVARAVALVTVAFPMAEGEGEGRSLKVELGDHSAFPVAYSSGRAPEGDGEIALSALNADELGRGVGDSVSLVVAGKRRDLAVSGLYSDITNGGRTAKASFAPPDGEAMWAVACVSLADGVDATAKRDALGREFPFAKVSVIGEYVRGTFGTTIDAVRAASAVALAVSLAIAALVTALFARMLVAMDATSIAALKAIGFRRRDIAIQYFSRSALVLALGVLSGTLAANTVGESIAGAAIASFGATTFDFAVDPVAAFLAYPLAFALAVAAASAAGSSGAGRLRVPENIKE